MTDAGDSHLNQDERDEVRERSNPPALILHEAIRLEGQEELKRSTSSLLWSGLAAGLSMGFSMVGEALRNCSPGWQLVSSYPRILNSMN